MKVRVLGSHAGGGAGGARWATTLAVPGLVGGGRCAGAAISPAFGRGLCEGRIIDPSRSVARREAAAALLDAPIACGGTRYGLSEETACPCEAAGMLSRTTEATVGLCT